MKELEFKNPEPPRIGQDEMGQHGMGWDRIGGDSPQHVMHLNAGVS